MTFEKPRIDPEFAAFLPKPTAERVGELLAQLQSEGCRDPLVVWSEENILVDGHTRFDLCEIHSIEYGVKYLDFDSRDDVFDWMCANQLARRNLTDEQRTYYIGKEYLLKRKKHGGEQVVSGATRPPKTEEIVAKSNDVSPKTVRNSAKFAEAVDAHEKKKPGSKEKILRGEAGPKKKVIETAPVLCYRCQKNGPARNCRYCAEEAAQKAAAKKAKKPDAEVFVDHRKLPVAGETESPEADLLTSCEKGGGHPFLELKESVKNLSADFTKACKDHGEDSQRLHLYLGYCGLLEHIPDEDPKKHNRAKFILLKGVSKIIEMAGQGGKELSQKKVVAEWMLASGGYIPPLTRRRRDAKAGKR